MTDQEIYKAPDSDVEIREELPESFRQGPLSAAKLRLAGFASILYFLIFFPIIGFSFMAGLDSGAFELWADLLTVLSLVIWVYLIQVFKSFLNLRLSYVGADTYIYALIVVNILTGLSSLLIDDLEGTFSFWSIAYFVLLIPSGIVTALFGKRLLQVASRYRYLPLFAWTTILGGICIATVVLFVLAVPLSLVSTVAMMLIFFNAADELRNLSQQ